MKKGKALSNLQSLKDGKLHGGFKVLTANAIIIAGNDDLANNCQPGKCNTNNCNGGNCGNCTLGCGRT